LAALILSEPHLGQTRIFLTAIASSRREYYTSLVLP
jgi:hypothetical protein